MGLECTQAVRSRSSTVLVTLRLPPQTSMHIKVYRCSEESVMRSEGSVIEQGECYAVSNEPAPRQPLEHAERRPPLIYHRRNGQEKGLLQLVLPGRRGVGHLVGEGDPARAGRKLHGLLFRSLLELAVLFHAVVELHHQRV